MCIKMPKLKRYRFYCKLVDITDNAVIKSVKVIARDRKQARYIFNKWLVKNRFSPNYTIYFTGKIVMSYIADKNYELEEEYYYRQLEIISKLYAD